MLPNVIANPPCYLRVMRLTVRTNEIISLYFSTSSKSLDDVTMYIELLHLILSADLQSPPELRAQYVLSLNDIYMHDRAPD